MKVIYLILFLFDWIKTQITIDLKRSEKGSSRRLQSNVPMKANNQGFYFTLGIGTPAQFFNVEIDTGSWLFWIPSNDIKTYYGNSTFDNTKSTTFKTNNQFLNISYLDNSLINGILAYDNIFISNTTIKNFGFLLANKDGKGFTPSANLTNNYDGLIGLNYNYQSYSRVGVNSFVTALYLQGSIPQNMFSMSQGNGIFQITLGGINPMIVNNNLIYYNNVQISSNYWNILMHGMGSKVLNYTFSLIATIDSGTNIFVVAKSQYNNIPSLFNSSQVSQCNNDNSLFICNYNGANLPDIIFNFGGYSYIMKQNDYISFSTNTRIKFALYAGSDNSFIVGGLFLNNYYTIYDYTNSRVGFVTQKYSINNIDQNSTIFNSLASSSSSTSTYQSSTSIPVSSSISPNNSPNGTIPVSTTSVPANSNTVIQQNLNSTNALPSVRNSTPLSETNSISKNTSNNSLTKNNASTSSSLILNGIRNIDMSSILMDYSFFILILFF